MLRHEGVLTVEFGFGIQTAHSTDEYTTTATLIRNATMLLSYPTSTPTGSGPTAGERPGRAHCGAVQAVTPDRHSETPRDTDKKRGEAPL